MTIKKVCEKYNIQADSLRYYEQEGVIRDVPRVNGIRRYNEQNLKDTEFILCMKRTGMIASEIKDYMILFEQGDSTKEERRRMLLERKKKAENSINELHDCVEYITEKLDRFYS